MTRVSLRAAIDAMCRSCIYDSGSGNGGWREQVQACSSANCPLHPVRPLPVKTIRRAASALQHGSSMEVGSTVGSAFPAGKVGLNDHMVDERRAA